MSREFQAAKERRFDDYDRDVTQAWNIVAIYAQARGKKKMPALQGLLAKRHAGHVKQSPREMKQVLEGLGKRWNTKPRVVKKEPRG